ELGESREQTRSRTSQVRDSKSAFSGLVRMHWYAEPAESSERLPERPIRRRSGLSTTWRQIRLRHEALRHAPCDGRVAHGHRSADAGSSDFDGVASLAEGCTRRAAGLVEEECLRDSHGAESNSVV